MPKFETPEPIAVTLDLGVGQVRFVAADRADTTVEVRPTDESDESDVKAAKQVRADFSNGTLHVTGPKAGLFDFSRKTRSVDVTIELPAGSRVSAEVQAGGFSATGVLGQSRFKTAAGNVSLDRTGPLTVDTSVGHITVEEIAGNAEITTASGKIQLGPIAGTAAVKNSNGDTTIASATGDVRVRSANGDITVDSAEASVDAKTSNGAIRLREIVRGAATLETAMGDLEIGIAEGTAAWLDVKTGFGHVRNEMTASAKPSDAGETVEVRAHTSFGGILVHRS
ncbi:DUF4097 family beta strand repeat-containing protein [Amycolatopsis benzoatilytica]|uniref:DUF4097 family beta strand repeat-containing protein n=1 Tax=Amycolatopsis benzoatilytica TaxID=346045 RepID=UPI00036BFE6F|nr:DUF4097 family beta strand repeat-containing protein [Amycolatopsis benzoatilytica]